MLMAPDDVVEMKALDVISLVLFETLAETADAVVKTVSVASSVSDVEIVSVFKTVPVASTVSVVKIVSVDKTVLGG